MTDNPFSPDEKIALVLALREVFGVPENSAAIDAAVAKLLGVK